MLCCVCCSLVGILVRAGCIMVLYCFKNDFLKAGIGLEQVEHGIVFRERGEEGVEESKEAIEGAALNAHEAIGADHVHLKLFL